MFIGRYLICAQLKTFVVFGAVLLCVVIAINSLNGFKTTQLVYVADDDDNGNIELFGHLNRTRKYAVLSTTSTWTSQSTSYIFLLPLTVLAWKRVGFDCVVIIVGSADVWNSDSLLYIVLSRVKELEAVVIFVRSPLENSVMISQVGECTLACRYSQVPGTPR